MSTATETDQEREPVDAEEDERDHIYCCNPDEAVCGTDISKYWVECVPGCTQHPLCPLCWVLHDSIDWQCHFCGEGWAV